MKTLTQTQQEKLFIALIVITFAIATTFAVWYQVTHSAYNCLAV